MAKKQAPKDFGFGEDEEMLRDVAKQFLDEHLPVETLRRLVAEDHESVYDRGEPTRWDSDLWKQIVELGWTGLAVPEANGGVGINLAGIAGLIEEVGRHALPSPLLPTLHATFVLREAGGETAEAWLGRIADGQTATLAFADTTGRWDPASTPLSARDEGGDLVIDGEVRFVQDAFKCDQLLTIASLGDRVALCVVPVDAEGLTLSRDQIHDLTRDQATARFESVRVSADNVVSTDGAASLQAAWPAVLTTVAADLCGSAEWQLQTTVKYAQDRKQFDHPLGFFQAVKHPLVDVMIGIDRARSIVYHAACQVDLGSPDAEVAARMAKSAASDAGAYASDRSVQLHGGIGFTWESDVHIFFKRSMHDQVLYGDGAHQRRKLADSIIGPIGAPV
jgi:alkylation response protein AidB-like acyl-CoA dehydrogenase